MLNSNLLNAPHRPPTNELGKWGLEHDCLPHVCNKMTIFDEAWSNTKRATVIKCWIKSNCLPAHYVEQAKLSLASGGSDTDSWSLESPVHQSTADALQQDITAAHYQQRPETPLSELLEEANRICESNNELLDALNTPAPFDRDPNPHEIAEEQLQYLYDDHVRCASQPQDTTSEILEHEEENEATPQPSIESLTENQIGSILQMYQATQDEELGSLLEKIQLRSQSLQGGIDGTSDS